MKVIKRVEVNYLRSLYKASLNDTGDVNVIFGRNDSGKSNVLRALNLFFNDETEPKSGTDFDLDMSTIRKSEAQKVKGRQFIWIKVTFSIPENFRRSLGEEVTVKKQWNRDGNITETIWPNDISFAQLTKFRNQIDFTYIPAIKDLEVYADLIERMYGAAAETAVLQQATKNFVGAIQGETQGLSDQLSDLFGGPARLSPPTEMKRLFRHLDFAHGDEGHSLLRQKGDGIKARHLPELLRFINASESGKKYFIWGFEEPENSLDLGAADLEATRFSEFGKRSDTQIFITSHSPAFYLTSAPDQDTIVRRYFVTKQTAIEDGSILPQDAVSAIDDLSQAERSMGDAGLLQLPYVIKSLSSLKEYNKRLEADIAALKDTITALQAPTLFVEGSHDVSAFTHELEAEGRGDINVVPLGGTPKSASELISSVLMNDGTIGRQPLFFLFDNDKAGRQAFRNLCGNADTSVPSVMADNIRAWVLPKTPEFENFCHQFGIRDDQGFFTAEFLFPIEEAADLCANLIRGQRRREIRDWKRSIHGDYWKSLSQKTCLDLLEAAEGTADWLYARGVPDCIKEVYLEQVREREFNTEFLKGVVRTVADQLH